MANEIIKKTQQWIHFPETEQEFQHEANLWSSKFEFPMAIDVIDCSLFEIKKPSVFGNEYICRKGYAAINMQATCNANELFTSVDCSWAGSVHDARVWRNSSIKEIISNEQINTKGWLLIGDEGYPLSNTLMTIYRNQQNLSEVQRAFNNLLKKERIIIERMFGQLKMRFPILSNCIRVKTENIPKLILVCCILHNISKLLNDLIEFDVNDFDDDYNEDETDQHNNNDKRNAIAQLIHNRLHF